MVGIKVLLLRKVAGFTKDEVRAVFRSRLAEPFDLKASLWPGPGPASWDPLAICLSLVYANGLGPAWVALAVAVSFSNTFFELLSPRGTDDFTMATANALLSWAFGSLMR